MNLNSLFVDDDLECPLCYTQTPYGCPGQESLLYGRLTQMKMGQSRTENYELPWKQAERFCESDAVDKIWCVQPLAIMATNPWSPSSSHAIERDIATRLVDLSSEVPKILQKTEIPKESVSLTGRHGEQRNGETTGEGNWGVHAMASLETDVVKDGRVVDEVREKKLEGSRPERFHGILKKNSTSSTKKTKKPQKKPKGLTMCLRTLLRQLLAGTEWIMDTSICKEKAIHLIKILIGPELENMVELDFPNDRQASMPKGWRQGYHAQILADIVRSYAGKTIKIDALEKYITLSRGPYHLSSQFEMLLGGRQWPPCMPDERFLRAYGCHHRTDLSNKKKNRLPAKRNRIQN